MKSKPSKSNRVSVNQLSNSTGADRRTISKWLEQEGIKAGKDKLFDEEEATEAIHRHRKEVAENLEESPFKAKAAEEVVKLKRENRIADALERRDYMKTGDVESAIMMGITKIEQVPVKMESEFGLPKNVITRLTQLIDEARTEWSKILEEKG